MPKHDFIQIKNSNLCRIFVIFFNEFRLNLLYLKGKFKFFFNRIEAGFLCSYQDILLYNSKSLVKKN